MKSSLKTKLGIFILSFFLQAMNTLALALSGVAETFPEASVTAVQMVFTLCTLFSIVGNLIAGKLATSTTKKRIVLLFSALTVAGAALAYLLGRSIPVLYAGSALIGLSTGLLIPVSSALIAEHFEGTERAAVMGQQALFTNGGAILLNMAAGLLVINGWRNVYFVFLGSVLVILSIAFLLPAGGVESAQQDGEKRAPLGAFVATLLVQGFLFGIAWTSFMTNVTMYVAELGADVSQATILTMVQSGFCVLMGLGLGFVMKKTGKYCFTLAISLGALAMWLFFVSRSFPMLLLSSAVLGLGFGLFMPSGFTLLPSAVRPSSITLAMSLFTAAFSLGGFVNPYIVTTGAALIGPAVANRFLVAAVIMTLDALFSFYSSRKLTPEGVHL